MNPDHVLNFWFGQPLEIRSEWFRKDANFDAQIKAQFLSAIEAAANGEQAAWLNTPSHSLAYIILLDQFPRNIFRNDAQSFAYDHLALAAAKAAVCKGFDQKLTPLEQLFIYLPFEHSESLSDQEQAVELMMGWQVDEKLQGFYDYAVKHHAVIQRFGRFPHRNQLLGRNSTAEELDYLSQPGAGF
ncbi:DUF924 family protein [Iodobacter fluviatilis]|uniref:DUF924 domain-containing protein n=1 Tax=Iodobacter fluviatilis TaxID=537 RepID=A0A7G3G6D3_9NEIS|nr:DUF924 family protein [Iodobacter fluviatilis]QBC42742.1 DUF924 domain-containing protein [Iodobacter fluviatilis]